MTTLKAQGRKFIVGYRPAVSAREDRMLGIRQALDGPVFEKKEHAEYWCWEAMVDHYDRGLAFPTHALNRLKA